MAVLHTPIVRVVHMFFKPEFETEFLQLFDSRKELIRHFPGCQSVALVKNHENLCAYSTISLWQSADNLELYRQSDLFKDTWSKTKIGFSAPPRAISYPVVHYLP